MHFRLLFKSNLSGIAIMLLLQLHLVAVRCAPLPFRQRHERTRDLELQARVWQGKDNARLRAREQLLLRLGLDPLAGLNQQPIVETSARLPSTIPSTMRPTEPPTKTVTKPQKFILPSWVTAPYAKSIKLEDRNAFNLTITGKLTLAKKRPAKGGNNAGVYAVASYTPSRSRTPLKGKLLMKVLKSIDDDAFAEVKALRIVGQLVDAGMYRLEDTDEKVPIIVMKQMPGYTLTSVPGYREALASDDSDTRRMMVNQTLGMMCEAVTNMALDMGFLHRDNIIDNVLVLTDSARPTTVTGVNIIDWGGKYLSTIRDDVTKDDLMTWCRRRWAPTVWGLVP